MNGRASEVRHPSTPARARRRGNSGLITIVLDAIAPLVDGALRAGPVGEMNETWNLQPWVAIFSLFSPLKQKKKTNSTFVALESTLT